MSSISTDDASFSRSAKQYTVASKDDILEKAIVNKADDTSGVTNTLENEGTAYSDG